MGVKQLCCYGNGGLDPAANKFANTVSQPDPCVRYFLKETVKLALVEENHKHTERTFQDMFKLPLFLD